MNSATLVVSLDRAASRATVSRVLELLGVEGDPDPGLRWHDEGFLTVRPGRPTPEETLHRVRELPGILRVIRLDGGLAAGRSEPSVIELPNGRRIGDGGLSVIAGPCSVEGEEQVCGIAERVREAGAVALRGGVFKPRTSPYSFAGLGELGLEFLAKARARTGLPIVTEVLEPGQIDRVAAVADVLQIGSRNMQNFPLLFRVGAHPSARPVLLKRGLAATIEELLLAAEYVLLGRLMAGREPRGVILCERGIRTFDQSLRFTLDVGAIPVLREKTTLPVFADPSHPAGERRFVAPLALASAAAGADGLLVEVHTDPDRAWSDGPQCLDAHGFASMMKTLRELPAAVRAR